MKLKKRDIFSYAFVGVVVIFAVYATIYGIRQHKSLTENIEYTSAVIEDFSFGMRGRSYMDYFFFVNGVKYQGRGAHFPASDTFVIGDTIVVIYDRTNPNNSKTERDYERADRERPFLIPAFIFVGLIAWLRVSGYDKKSADLSADKTNDVKNKK